MARRKFEVGKEPHVAEIGDDVELKFVPELVTSELIEPLKALQQAQKRILGQNPEQIDVELTQENVVAMRDLLGALMLPDSAEAFASMTLPDRIVVQLVQWVMEVYGERPTGPSSGSPKSPSSNGSASTETSPDKEPQTLSTGASPAS